MATGPGMDHVITHGICEACAMSVLADIEAIEYLIPERHSPKTRKTHVFSVKPAA
jgi:hypothetical protein